jgi:hypothetical protein
MKTEARNLFWPIPVIRTSQGWTRVILTFEFHFIHVFLAGLLLPPAMCCQKSSDIAIYIDLYFAHAEFWIDKISDLVRACMPFEQRPWPSNLFRHVWRSTLGVHDNKNGASVASHRWVPLGRGLSSFVVALWMRLTKPRRKNLLVISSPSTCFWKISICYNRMLASFWE